jgi:hypothetical protein
MDIRAPRLVAPGLPFLQKRPLPVSGADRIVIREGFVIDYKSILIEHDEALRSWKEYYRADQNIL